MYVNDVVGAATVVGLSGRHLYTVLCSMVVTR